MGVIMLALIIVVGILGLEWIRSGRRHGPVPPGADPERLDRLESALSGLESRLDDLQEQQRFLERLLEQRPAPDALPRGDSQDAPQHTILFDEEAGED